MIKVRSVALEDAKYLVRQDEKWLEIKREFFEKFTNFEEDEV